MDKCTLLVSDDKRSHEVVGKKLLLGSWCLNNDYKNDSERSKLDSDLRIDRGYTNHSYLYNNARLIVHCYDSTGILETLSTNIPTLAYFQNGSDH